MKSITVHNLDDQLASLIEKRARESGLSLNKTIKMLLRKALGLTPTPEEDKKKEFLDLFNVWSEEDYKEFERNIEDLNKVDPEEWN